MRRPFESGKGNLTHFPAVWWVELALQNEMRAMCNNGKVQLWSTPLLPDFPTT